MADSQIIDIAKQETAKGFEKKIRNNPKLYAGIITSLIYLLIPSLIILGGYTFRYYDKIEASREQVEATKKDVANLTKTVLYTDSSNYSKLSTKIDTLNNRIDRKLNVVNIRLKGIENRLNINSTASNQDDKKKISPFLVHN